MRARHLRLGAAIVWLLAVAMAAGTAPAAATADDRAPTLRVEILGTDTGGLDQLIAMAGAPHRAEVAVRVTNTGTGIERDVVVRVQTTGSAAMTAPVDLAPGEAITSISTVTLSALPGASHEIVASAGTTTVSVTHGQAPWLLLGAAALGVHILALGARDRLRARVARAEASGGYAKPSPSQT
ncbi:MAG: hypothetical protein ACE367_21210 [Acidimicrobiales bacterium]